MASQDEVVMSQAEQPPSGAGKMTKKELAEWLIEPLPDGFVSKDDVAKALFSTIREQSAIMRELADALQKLDPKHPALQRYRQFTKVML